MESEGLSALVDNRTRNRGAFCTYTSSRRNIKDTKVGTCKDEADSSVCGQLNMGMAEDEVRVADYRGLVGVWILFSCNRKISEHFKQLT